MTPPNQVAETKSSIEDIATKFESMEHEAKTIMEATTQFWQSIVQDEQLDHLPTQVQEAEVQLTTLKTSLRAMPLMVQITLAEELKDLQQRVGRAQERKQKRHTQLDEFQEIGGQLGVKEVAMMQEVQEH